MFLKDICKGEEFGYGYGTLGYVFGTAVTLEERTFVYEWRWGCGDRGTAVFSHFFLLSDFNI